MNRCTTETCNQPVGVILPSGITEFDRLPTSAVLQTENAVVGIKADREQIEKLPAISRIGTITSTVNDPRVVQLVVKYVF